MNKHPLSYRSGFIALAILAVVLLAACASGPTLPAPIPVELEQKP